MSRASCRHVVCANDVSLIVVNAKTSWELFCDKQLSGWPLWFITQAFI